ncbi:MAG: penicillin-binding transpeptidase domain-containing protein [Christensenellales bacterium]|jgi:stage V sporulation protein D (sporulation-specific penicillin-binding protein)
MLVTFLFVGLFMKLSYVQLIQGRDLQAKALDQWTRDVPSAAKRGIIYDINGVKLADTSTLYTVYIRPNAVTDFEVTASALAEILNMDLQKLYQKITTTRVSEITIKKKVTKEQTLKIKASNATGVYLSEEVMRYYPFGDFLTQVLGFTNIDGVGQTGIEGYYNDYLAGIHGYQLTETDLVGRELEGGIIRYIPSVPGLNISLTIDYVIQSAAERAVKDALLTHGAKSASAIVMNARTGEIAAMAEAPSFDLNDIPRDNFDLLMSASRSTLVSNVFEPGSTFKIVTAAAAIDSDLFKPNKTFYCPNHKIVDGERIKCWQRKGHGSQTFAEGVANSCNVVFMETALALGTERFYGYIDKLGFFQETGIDMKGEAQAMLIPEVKVKTVDLARIGFGQAIAVTGIELVRAMAAIINGGYMVTPHLLDSVTDPEGKTVYRNYNLKGEQVLKESTSKTMRELLTGVVRQGSGKKAGIPGYMIGGKTGTAQKYEGGHIAQGKYVSSFIGYLTTDKEEYVCMVIVDEPKGWLYYGSIVAAPYVANIFSTIVSYKNIPPKFTEEEMKESKKSFVMPDLTGLSAAKAAATLARYGMHYEVVGDSGTVIDQVPVPGSFCNSRNLAVIRLSG